MAFGTLGLCEPLLLNIAEQGYTVPTPVQRKAIPLILSHKDLIAIAQTGTGKTAAFTLPMLQRLAGGPSPEANCIRGLIITPTRELAAQVANNVDTYSRNLAIRVGAVYGGVRIEPQIAQLQTGLHILVATPGRLIDLYNQQVLTFAQLEILVLDEADRMLDLGFIDDIRHIQTLLPKKRQTLMFSATFSAAIRALAEGMLDAPQVVEVTVVNSTVETVKQQVHPVDKARKSELLFHLVKKYRWQQTLVFSRTKRGADLLVTQLKAVGISADSIHGNRTQHARTLALDGFKSGTLAVLVATDIAARGIDIQQLPCVVNYDLPFVPEDYVHRIGRTGRVGSAGLAISLVSDDESKQLQAIERLIGRKLKLESVVGFAPTVKAPDDSPDEEMYGNFEPDPKPQDKNKTKGRSRSNKSANRSSSRRR